MNTKEIAIELIRKLPDEASLMDIAQELEFVAGIKEGIAELDQGEHFTADEILKRIPSWAKRTQ